MQKTNSAATPAASAFEQSEVRSEFLPHEQLEAHGFRHKPEIVVDAESSEKPNFYVLTGLHPILEAMDNIQTMKVELTLRGRVWMMLQEAGLSVEEVIGDLLEESLELRRLWMERTGELEKIQKVLAPPAATAGSIATPRKFSIDTYRPGGPLNRSFEIEAGPGGCTVEGKPVSSLSQFLEMVTENIDEDMGDAAGSGKAVAS